jgi:DNA-binding NarL/FixJ family response regulator
MPSDRIRVLVWASYPALRAGLSGLIRDEGFSVAAELGATVGLETIDIAADVLVADVDADSEREVTRLAALLSLPSIFILASGDARQVAARDLDAARGWVSRDVTGPELATAIRAVAAGLLVIDPSFASDLFEEAQSRVPVESTDLETQLTARELDVLRWLAAGLPNKAIALELGISEHTVKFHVGSVLSKLDARSRTEAVTTAARRGLLAL